jgi:hypothetical protein
MCGGGEGAVPKSAICLLLSLEADGKLRRRTLLSLPALTPGRVPHVRRRLTWAEYDCFFE